MPTTQERIKDLIRQGLSRVNLLELIANCETLIPAKPAIYCSLVNCFRLLEQEYESIGAIDRARYDSINALLQKPLLDLIDAETQSAGAILLQLDRVMIAFEKLSHP